jgi:membrane protease YdiL (CAAX protease family)
MNEHAESFEPIPSVIPVVTAIQVGHSDSSLPSVVAVDAVERRGKGWPVLAWLVIGFIVTGIVAAPYFFRPPREEGGRDRVGNVLMELQARYLVGAGRLVGGTEAKQLYAQAQTLNVGTLGQRLRFVVLAGEMKGPAEAQRLLDQLDQLVAQSKAKPAEEARTLKAILHQLYDDYTAGRLDAPSLDAEERRLLRDELDWFGDLALAPAEGPNPEAREVVLRAAGRTTFVVLGIFIVATGLGLLGFGGLIFLLVLMLAGKLRRGITSTSPDHGVYAETFALWMLLFLALSVGAAAVPAEGNRLLISGVAMLGSLAALGWPVLRGIPWSQVRREIGWTAGRMPLLEPVLGAASYVMALPLLVIGLLITLGLMMFAKLLVGGGTPDALEPTNMPQHPIVEHLAGPNWGLRLQVLFVASFVAPVVEETVFRGVLYRHLRDATARWRVGASVVFAGLVNSFVFAVIHPQGLFAVPALMSLALAFSLAREWRGTLIPAMVAHGINNGVLLMTVIFAFGGA